MKRRLQNIVVWLSVVVAMTVLLAGAASAQMMSSSHKPTVNTPPPSGPPTGSYKPVVRVNGTVLTEHDLMRELYTIFPYAQMHNGVPKGMEPEMRRGAMDMIVFEELLYQEAVKKGMTLSPERLKQAEREFRKQFATQDQYEAVLKTEVNGSLAQMRNKIKRALLIDQMMNKEVTAKSRVSFVEAKSYYDKNSQKFTHPEYFRIQTISILPPQDGGPGVANEAKKLADSAIKKAKATKSYQEFGLLAEKMSDDDWHVNMGDRKDVSPDKLPPEVVKALRAMKVGDVSDLIQLGPAYTIVRLNAHTPAGVAPFSEVKGKLREDLQKEKYNQVRAQLNKQLRQNAKVEEL